MTRSRQRRVVNIAERYDALQDGLTKKASDRFVRELERNYDELTRQLLAKFDNISSRASLIEAARLLEIQNELGQALNIAPIDDRYTNTFDRLYRDVEALGGEYALEILREVGAQQVSNVAALPLEAIRFAAIDSAKRLAGHGQTFADNAARTLSTAVAQGLSYRQVSPQLQQLKELTKYQADRIARTESSSVYNDAAALRYEQRGVKYVRWLASKGEQVCPFCAARNGNVYELRKVVIPNHPFCSCVTLPYKPEWEDEEDGEFWTEYRENGLQVLKDAGKEPNYGVAPFEKSAPKAIDTAKLISKITKPDPDLDPVIDVEPEIEPPPAPPISPTPPDDNADLSIWDAFLDEIAKQQEEVLEAEAKPLEGKGYNRTYRQLIEAGKNDPRVKKMEAAIEANQREIRALNRALAPLTAKQQEGRSEFLKVIADLNKEAGGGRKVSAKRRAFFDEQVRLVEEIEQIESRLWDLRRDAAREFLSDLKSRPAMSLSDAVELVDKVRFVGLGALESSVREAAIEYFQVVGPGASNVLTQFVQRGDRAWANAGSGYINIGRGSKASIWHELGHFAEDASKAGDEMAAWVRSRATGPEELLSVLMDFEDYGDEKALPDKFVSPYVGKLYPPFIPGDPYSTEVISMGIERLVDEEALISWYEADPEHFYLVIGFITP